MEPKRKRPQEACPEAVETINNSQPQIEAVRDQPTMNTSSILQVPIKGNGSGDLIPMLFNLTDLRLGQDFETQVGVKKALLTVPVRKPTRQEFVRVHPDPDFRLDTAVVEIKDDRETYLVDRSLWSALPDELRPVCLFTTINRQDVVFLWPVVLPRADNRINAWHQSALQAVQLAMKSWIRVVPKMTLGAYEVYEATAALPEPTWPGSAFEELVGIAFRNHFVNSVDHPVMRRMRGEV